MIKYALLDVAVADAATAVLFAVAGAAAVESYWSYWRLAQFFGSIIYNWLQLSGKKNVSCGWLE